MNSYMAKSGAVEQKWYVVDGDGKVFGRVASQVASILRGKKQTGIHTFCGHRRLCDRCERRKTYFNR